MACRYPEVQKKINLNHQSMLMANFLGDDFGEMIRESPK
jgi:hypothetical protein